MSNKLIILMGKSGAGKSTIEKILENDYGFKRVISTTTRKPRSGEVPFVDYYFIPEEVFQIYKRRKEFLEVSQYPTSGVMHSYGVHNEDVTISREDNILVTERTGYEQLKKTVGRENIIAIYIDAAFEVRADRYRKRDSNYNEFDIGDRAKRDDEMFEGIEDDVDIVVYNDGNINKTVSDLIRKILVIKNKKNQI